MRRHVDIIKSADDLYKKLTKDFADFAGAKANDFDSLSTLSYEDAHEGVKRLIEGARAIIEGCFSEDGVSFPKYLVNLSTYNAEDKLSEVSLVIKSKLKDAVKYKKEVTLRVGDTFMNEFIQAHINSVFEMYYRHEAHANLEEVNAFIAQICADNEIPYTFGFSMEDSNEFITYIDNDTVVFNASIDAAIEVSKNGLFLSGDEYSDLVREQQIEKLVNALSTTHTTVQLIKANVDIINTLVGYKTKRRVDKIIRTAYHKKAEYFDKVKSGFGYYEREEGDSGIFAILEKHTDGTITVALNPFDIKTLMTVDVDVLGEVNKLLEK